jgi:GT2 family glycosyltransferase
MNLTPLVSIITVNYNQLFYTLELLKSLQKLTYPNVEIIVVDNGSTENPETQLNTLYPQVRTVISKKNLGFAGGNNLGVEIST